MTEQIQHQTTVPLADRSLAELEEAVATLRRRGVPCDARASVSYRSQGSGGSEIVATWTSEPAPVATLGRLVLRRLRSGTLALVRLRRG